MAFILETRSLGKNNMQQIIEASALLSASLALQDAG
jgi:hypothetical protein